ncbi:N-acetyltransferase B complex non catalytic subunit-domain-containing protein, partial [Jimgerdemannia flammicorona]
PPTPHPPQPHTLTLFPLLEFIDNGNYKPALQHANKILKKTPDALIVKALKAVILERTGKSDEALQLCQEVKKAQPTDEAVLQATTTVYRELGKHDEIVAIYEAAAKKQPQNEEFGNHWFMAMVRNGDYKGQKEAALKLHKSFKGNKYLFWAIMSLVLQGEQAKTGLTNLFYTLAERMMLKAVEEKRVVQTEELRLYLLILLAQDKHAEALAVLEGELVAKSSGDPEIRQMKVDLMMRNRKWVEVNTVCRKVLEKDNSDDWISWLAYLESLFHITADEAMAKAEGPVEYTRTLDEARAFVCTLQLKPNTFKRGSFLAELELELRSGDQNADPARLVDLAVAYFDRFGSKAACFEDLQPYVKKLAGDKEAARAFVARLAFVAKLAPETTENSGGIRNLHKQINIRKFERFLGLHDDLNAAEAIKLVDVLWAEYIKALPYGSDLEATERQYGDDYVILAAHLILDLYHRSGSTEDVHLVQAVTLLEHALAKSKHNFQFKLLLVRLYLILGVFNRALDIYKTMDIKHVQHDTLSHYLTDRSHTLGFFDQAREMLSESLAIYRSNDVETPEMVVKAYQFATFSKIQEFIEFRTRLENSLQHALVNITILRLETLKQSFTVKNALQFYQELDVAEIKYDDEYLKTRSDNRDFSVMLSCNPAGRPTAEELTRIAPRVDETWTKVFSLIILVIKRAGGGGTTDVEPLAEALMSAAEAEDVGEHLTSRERQLARFVARLSSAYALAKKAATGDEAGAAKAGKLIKEAYSILESEATSLAAATYPLQFSWSRFHAYTNTLEACNYGLILSELINRSMSVGKTVKKGALLSYRAATVKHGAQDYSARPAEGCKRSHGPREDEAIHRGPGDAVDGDIRNQDRLFCGQGKYERCPGNRGQNCVELELVGAEYFGGSGSAGVEGMNGGMTMKNNKKCVAARRNQI